MTDLHGQPVASGCDRTDFWATAGQDVAAFSYGGMNMTFYGSSVSRITNDNLNNLHENGVALTLFYENTFGLGPQGEQGYAPNQVGALYFTYDQGVFDANDALRFVATLESSVYGTWPNNRPIYFTTDEGYDSSVIDRIRDYCRGILSVMDLALIGMYGSNYIIDTLYDDGLISWGWQASATAWPDNATLGTHTNVWQYPVAYTPSGAVTINGEGVDGDFAYTYDFGQWPAPNSLPLAKALNLHTGYDLDKIIGIHTGSFSVAAPTLFSSFKTATDTYNTTFGNVSYFQGIFSTDSGATWNDLGVYVPNLTTAGQPVLQTVTCQGYITSAGVFTAVGTNWYDFVHSSGSSKTIQYKVAFFSSDSQGAITPTLTDESLTYLYTYNSQKIYSNGSFANSGSNEVINHNLGYIPKVRAFFVPSSSTDGSDGVYTIPANAMTTLDWFYAHTNVYANADTVTFTPVTDNAGTVSGTVYWRIYLDD